MNYLSDKEMIDAGLCHSIHTSERKAFRGCRRRWDWSYRQNYHPIVQHKALEFGIAYHTAMEVWYEPSAWRGDRETQSALAVAAFSKVCNEQLKRFRELLGDPDESVLLDYRERLELGVAMVKYYTQRISPKLDANLTPLMVEVPFEVPLGFYCKCDSCWHSWQKSELGIRHHDDLQVELNDKLDNYRYEIWRGLPVTFGGRIDAIFSDEQGRILVFDWKTAMRMLNNVDEAAFLELDDQVGGYPVAIYKSGRRVDGFIYHEQRKAVPSKPKELKRRYKGKLFSTAVDEPVEFKSFLETVSTYDVDAYNSGLYDEYLAYLQGPNSPKFHQRFVVYKTQSQMDNFWTDLQNEAQDMLGMPRVYPQPSRFSCNSCLYRQPCEGKNRGEDYKYTLDTLFTKERL